MRLMSLHNPICRDQVLFCSFRGKQYSDNPRAISETLHRMRPDVKIVWMINKPEPGMRIPEYVRVVKPDTKEGLRTQVQSGVWVFNNDLPYGTRKRRGQFYIQTWHGDRSFKLVRYDAEKAMGSVNYKALYMVEDKICDLCVAGSADGEATFRTAFRYHGEILKQGCPRNDCLLYPDANAMAETRKILGLGDEKILLYAPTFRDKSRGKQVVDIDFAALKAALETATGDTWRILLRGHSLAGKLRYTAEDVVLDVSGYRDMAELLQISDILISDYSSSVNDYALLGRPVIFYQSDYELYKSENRAIRYEPADLGYPVVYDMAGLLDIIPKLGEMDFTKICSGALGKLGTCESGHASEAVCERILKFIDSGRS